MLLKLQNSEMYNWVNWIVFYLSTLDRYIRSVGTSMLAYGMFIGKGFAYGLFILVIVKRQVNSLLHYCYIYLYRIFHITIRIWTVAINWEQSFYVKSNLLHTGFYFKVKAARPVMAWWRTECGLPCGHVTEEDAQFISVCWRLVQTWAVCIKASLDLSALLIMPYFLTFLVFFSFGLK